MILLQCLQIIASAQIQVTRIPNRPLLSTATVMRCITLYQCMYLYDDRIQSDQYCLINLLLGVSGLLRSIVWLSWLEIVRTVDFSSTFFFFYLFDNIYYFDILNDL